MCLSVKRCFCFMTVAQFISTAEQETGYVRRIKVTECLLWRKKMPPCCKLLASTVSVAIHSPSQCHLAQSAHRLGWFCQSHREPPDVQLDWLISHTHLFRLLTLLSISISLFLKVLFFFFSDTTSFYRFFSFPWEPFALSSWFLFFQ